MSPFQAALIPDPTREGLRVATAGILPQSPTSAGAAAQHSPGAAQRSGRKPEPGGEGRRHNIRSPLASTALLQCTPTWALSPQVRTVACKLPTQKSSLCPDLGFSEGGVLLRSFVRSEDHQKIELPLPYWLCVACRRRTQPNCTILEPGVTHKDVKERALEAVVDNLLLQVFPDANVGLGRKTEGF